MAEDDGTYELKDDGDMAEIKGAPGQGWGKGPKPGDPDFVPPKVVIEPAPQAREEPAEEPAAPSAVTAEEIADVQDAEHHKAMGILAYVFFVIPLVAAPKSPFARFHANQGLITFILWWVAIVLVAVLEGLIFLNGWLLVNIPLLKYFFSCMFHLLGPLLLIACAALTLTGIVNAANGEKKRLPIVGTWNLLK
ncbi:MAG TPA: hypothetical protein VHQ47_11525 [Phycisphaerae bacterium]|nr:hypothetical protein [Phycisphaerae bacterium]